MAYSARESGVTKKRSPAQLVALVLGVAYVAAGVLGFALEEGGFLLDTFGINALHNFAHLGIGVALLASSPSPNGARSVCFVVGAAYLALAVFGFMGLEFMDDLLNINTADNFLHLASGAVALFVALPSTRTRVANAPATR